MKVLKFGGSSVADAKRIRSVAHIVLAAAKRDRVVVVVSAFQGVTNQLLQCARAAEKGDASYQQLYNQIAHKHREAIDALLERGKRKGTLDAVDGLLDELRNVLLGISLLRDCPPRALDLTASFGERLSATIISAYLQQLCRAVFVDARQFTVTDDQFTHAMVLFDQTNKKIRTYFNQLMKKSGPAPIPVVTGFIGSTEDGRTTTIGRNGSDYTAAIVGAALNAAVIEIWTDVDGILSADPRAVPSAFVLSQMSYEEAMELSYFGAKVLHPATIAPAVAKKIPIDIKNTLNPGAPGTRISEKAGDWEGAAKGIASVDNIALLTLRGLSMVGVPGTAERLFRALASHRVNVILISQASSEHTICFAVSTSDLAAARRALASEFHYELQSKLTSLDEKTNQTIVAIVGEGMRGTPGVSGKVFQALGNNGINVSAIAQGASERNISFVIQSDQMNRALNVIHEAFFEKNKHLAVILVGVGNIGSTLLRQLHQQRDFLLSQGYDVRVCGIANSKQYILDPAGIDLTSWRDKLNRSHRKMSLSDLARQISRLELINAVLVDCTASSDVVDAYPEFVNANLHIVTPNKKANVLPWSRYSALLDLMKSRKKHFLYEANVGAGLPVISTLTDLISSGDQIVKVEGIFSGTLSYLFNHFDGAKPFSEFVREAHQLGFTEPDPREDLSGGDVARKLLILARHLGMKLDMKDIQVESLVPPSLRKGGFSDAFYSRFAGFDRTIQQRFQKARTRGNALRYVGTLRGREASAELKEVPPDHPFAGTKGSDNIIAITTNRYSRTPLVVQGPGAGADVTAMGVFSDILKLLHYLPY
ncbi:MAG: bifunctional aspartate kinase/homoserine dehydrogenase I [Ignavibacteriales bacterium]|nr:bifunctional aspartate kinase/homoserine dehydrogenase I [Ignavibacteriales bacterium]